jgi:uncharacterized membrane protein (UPF0127 family)
MPAPRSIQGVPAGVDNRLATPDSADMTSFKTRAATAAALVLTSLIALAQTGPQKLDAIRLSAGMHVIQAELAQTPDQHSIGLMFRKSMGTNDGMLFAFDRPGQQCFWMKNTLIPLSVAFIADDGSVVNIDDMKPQTLDSHCSKQPVRFVLEMNEGWFVKRGIKAGSKILGQPFTP